MPWKGEKDPYKIWLSEIILQQTRVEQGTSYYERFISTYPRLTDLAKANDSEVFKLWEGLGYYTRCRNLLATARHISTQLRGQFPSTYEGILALKGVGPYTAAAISSFAFNLPHAVMDGNVYRVLARVFGVFIPSDTTEGKKFFSQLAASLLDKKKPGLYNQAIMDFGATVCKPMLPLCESCVFRTECYAFRHNQIAELPLKSKKIAIKKRWLYYLLIRYKKKVAVRERTGKDIWQHLFEFPLVELRKDTAATQVLKMAEGNQWLAAGAYEVRSVSPAQKQQLTHQLIAGQFIAVDVFQKPKLDANFKWVSKSEMKKIAFPKFINAYLDSAEKLNIF
jgi:A/G-specific adenine glycosylase